VPLKRRRWKHLLPRLPLGSWVEILVDWINESLGFLLDLITDFFDTLLTWILDFLGLFPPLILAVIVGVVAFLISRKIVLPIVLALVLLVVENLQMWDEMLVTLAIVLLATAVCAIIGIPTGIAMSRNETLDRGMRVILDFMQTMPSFVYLIPAVMFFSLGKVPGLIATIVFALPPIIRLTNLGIRQVPEELTEVADSFGSTPFQKLRHVQLPVAMPNIMAGANQTIMLSLSMAVIASMIGAGGLGALVLTGLTTLDIGLGFEAGLCIVIIAIILDRITQSMRPST